MAVTMDLGVDEAYRHEATVEREQTPELDRIGFERLIVTCACGMVWSGEHEIGYFDAVENGGDIEADEQVLGRWEAHVWEQIKAAGQYAEAAARSAKSSDDDGARWGVAPDEDNPTGMAHGNLPPLDAIEEAAEDDTPEAQADRIASQMGALGALGRGVESAAGRVPEWDTLTIAQQRDQVAEHYADVVARSVATLRATLASATATAEDRTATALWFAQNIRDQGDMMTRRFDELGGAL